MQLLTCNVELDATCFLKHCLKLECGEYSKEKEDISFLRYKKDAKSEPKNLKNN